MDIKTEIITIESDNSPVAVSRPKRINKKPVIIDLDSEEEDSSTEVKIKIENSETKRKMSKKRALSDSNYSGDSEEDKAPKKVRKKATSARTKKAKMPIKRSLSESNSEDDGESKKTKINKKVKEGKVPKSKVKAEVSKKGVSSISNVKLEWDVSYSLAETANINPEVAATLVNYFESGDTIPFIARYRREQTGNMNPEELLYCKETLEGICACNKKKDNIINVLTKGGHLTPILKDAVVKCKNMEELEYVYAPYKPTQKRSLVERAKELGLEESALNILNNTKYVNINTLINSQVEGLKTKEEVEKSLMHIIAHVICTNTETLEFIRDLKQKLRIYIESKKAKKEDNPGDKKFENYFSFRIPAQYVKPHQTLALNRGENLKVLSVKYVVPDYALHQFSKFILYKYGRETPNSYLIKNAIEDGYKRKIHALLVRQTKQELNTNAEKESIDTFAVNLKKLLLTTPIKGQAIMGIDPGFKIGCKVAVISAQGSVLDTDVIYPHSKNWLNDAEKIKMLLNKHRCSLITIGNGTACRETETWLSDLIKTDYFNPIDVNYTIVDECGASIYSCSPEAKKEFPDLDPLLVSAVSLARRVQDPLSELVKVDPQHLGVGMYQHDLNKKLLESKLNEVISESVSFVGVDLNTASLCLLKHVAGLTELRATNILEHKNKNGSFKNREQIRDVKGIGPKLFQQCAGFLRIGPTNADEAEDFFRRPGTNKLDYTVIHPEFYGLTESILRKFSLQKSGIGQDEFIREFSSSLALFPVEVLAKEFKAPVADVKLIVDELLKPINHFVEFDIRTVSNNKPVFRKGVTDINDLKVDMTVTGYVRNVTSFGAFVDIGVGVNGLIHTSKMSGHRIELGNKVEIKIINLDLKQQRIGLSLVNIL